MVAPESRTHPAEAHHLAVPTRSGPVALLKVADPRTAAIWHHPRFSSGNEGSSIAAAFWQDLYDANADVVINGHEHFYERYAPQDPTAGADAARGIRQFIAGTGGRTLRSTSSIAVNSEIRDTKTFGVVRFTLHAASYDWNFIPVAGQTFTDSGTGNCH